MANLDDIRRNNSADAGNVVEGSEFTGDVSGDQGSGLTVTGLRGVNISNASAPQNDNDGYIFVGTEFVLRTIVTQGFQTNSGEVRGNYDTGLNINNINNTQLSTDNFISDLPGQVLATNDANQLSPQLAKLGRDLYLTDATFTALNKDKIICDTSANAIVITPIATPVNGDFFEVFFSAGTPSANNVTITGVLAGATDLVLDALGAVILIFAGGAWTVQNIGTPRP